MKIDKRRTGILGLQKSGMCPLFQNRELHFTLPCVRNQAYELFVESIILNEGLWIKMRCMSIDNPPILLNLQQHL